jgi:hypothetical protein
MREIKPYRTEGGLMKALDNGGRLYNVMSRGGDKVITHGELAKAAGSFSTGINAFLFFEMAKCDLPAEAGDRAVDALETTLRKDYGKNHPSFVAPSEIPTEGAAGRTVIIEGYPRALADKAVMEAQVNLAVATAAGTGYRRAPLLEVFDAYEVFDGAQMKGSAAVLAAPHGTRLEAGRKVRIGGILRKLFYQEKDPGKPQRFVEGLYYTRL